VTFEGSDTTPGDIERVLIGIVVGLVRWARSNVVPVILSERQQYRATLPRGEVFDGIVDEVGRNARQVIEAMRAEADRLEAAARQSLGAAIDAEGSRHTRQWIAGVRAQAQVDLTALLRDDDLADFLAVRSEQANALITNLARDIHERIERQTLQAIYDGRSNADIAKSLTQIEGIGRQRARLIARDQASKLNGAMNEFRQRQAGVTHYKWRTIIDGRERPAHHANNGKVFAWDKPPGTGHPGHEINCRCRGLAIITDDPDEIERSATPPDLEPGDLDQFFVNTLPDLRKVAAVPRTNLGSLSAQDIAERLAATVNIDGQVATLARGMTEKQAERLVVELYGFLPDDKDIGNLLAGLQRLTATRKAALVNAARARLSMIEGVLRQAQIPVPPRVVPGVTPAPAGGSVAALARQLSSRPVTTPPIPPAAVRPPAVPPAPRPAPVKRYPTGKYFEREIGNATPIPEAERSAGEFVRKQGARTGHEWAVMHDDQGRVLARWSSGRPSDLDVDPAKVPEIYSPSHRVTFHHNHPSSSSFSVADIKAFEWGKGVEKVFAHGADGSTYAMSAIDRAYIGPRADWVHAATMRHMIAAVKAGIVPQDAANRVLAHTRMLVMERLGFVRYTYQLSGPTRTVVERSATAIDVIVSEVAASWRP